MEGVQRFKTLKNFLNNSVEFNSAVAQVEVAAKVQSAGYHIELEPNVGNGKADVLARKGDDEFFIEVSTVGEGDLGKYARETANDIWPLILVNGCIPAGRICRILSEEDRHKYQDEIKRVIEKVKSEGCCQEKKYKVLLISS